MDISELSDIQSESGIIGTLIYHPDFVLHTDWLKPSHFYGTENGCVYWAIQELYKDGITNIDAYNISNKLQSHNGVQKTIQKYNLPSMQEFVELYKDVARHTLEEYKALAKNVTGYAFKRDLIKTSNELIHKCYNKENNLDMLSAFAYGGLEKLTQKYIGNTDITLLGGVIDNIWGEIIERRSGDGMFGIPSKYPAFNEYFSYEAGELVMVEANFKQGKSVFLMNEVVHKLKNSVPSIVFDSEMSTRLYVERLLSHLSRIEIRRIKNGRYSSEEAKKIEKCIDWIKKQPFIHIYDPDMTDEKMYSICKMLKYKINLGFVVVDYLKSDEGTTGDNYNILGAKCNFLKNKIAGELDLAVLSACQLNRRGEVADSIKINRYSSVGITWGSKTKDMIAKDGVKSGNAFAKINFNRLGKKMDEEDENEYIDFLFDAEKMSILQAEQHERIDDF